MKLVKGVYLPDYDTHFEKFIDDEGNYQKKQFEAALKYIKPEDKGLFIDVGAHVGLWSRMAIKAGFRDVLAFEPLLANYDCCVQNLAQFTDKPKIVIEPYALSDEEDIGSILLDKNSNSGSGYIASATESEYFSINCFDKMYGINGIPKEFKNKTLIKIDVQGYEAKVVRGMTNFIKEYKPIIIVEQMCNQQWDMEATEYLKSLGMKVLEVVEKEVILGW